MYCDTTHGSSSFYTGGIALDMSPADSDLAGTAQWDPTSIRLVDDIPLLSPDSSNDPISGADDLLSFPSASFKLDSSPSASDISVRDPHSAPTLTEADDLPCDEPPAKVKTRRSQNRQAQRRFRERKQQQETTLMTRLQELQSENDELSLFITTLKQENCILESDKSRLYQEVELLRKWRSKLFGLMSKLVKEDEMTNDQQTTISRSCSNTCWRRGSEYLRLMVTMQTLLSLFDDLQLVSGGG
ncbi:hypothetical protein BJX62DRAFT_245578 [Aspergillus germanicus]